MSLEEQVGVLLVEQGLTLATAESCTGGLVAHRLTNIPGSSAYYLGGLVAYSNQAKEILLGVRPETLLAHGAVSEEVAREMACGARQRMGADVAVAVTGIAGPTGGSPEKPVGLVYVALSAADTEQCRRYLWQGDRLANKEQSAGAALQLLLAYLQGRREKMVEFINEPVSVEVQWRQDGTARPLAFFWHGHRYPIESWGRESVERRKEQQVHCYLVQTAGPETWELCQEIETARWLLTRHWARLLRTV